MASLTVKKVSKLVRAGEPGKHLDSGSADAVRGLHLVVVNKRNASWQLRYQIDKRTRWMGLGSARDVSLGKAREKAKREREKLADKIDPLAVRKAERATQRLAALKAITFAEAARAFVTQHDAAWKNRKHAAQVMSTLETYAFPVLGSLPVAAIDTPLVLRVIEPIWREKTETASRVRGRIESVLAWATVRGYRQGDNPARWKGHLQEALPARGKIAKVEHHAALPYAELPAFMTDLRQREGVAAKALMFTILTAARTGEVAGSKWSEVDLTNAVWTIAGSRMKAGKEHKVALAPQAVALLRDLPREGEDDDGYVFIGARPGTGLSDASMTAVLKRMGRGDITVHGMRSAFKDWASERTNYPNEVSEMALAHKVSDKVEAAYRRGDLLAKRKRLAADWAAYCFSPPAKGEVVPIGGAR
ncbi:MAG: tyrosine-type recombinase/integrase [Xanthobacteraceae bacterium]